MQRIDVKAEDINNLIYYYLQETGSVHTAFVFKQESMVDNQFENIPPNALISLIHKGMLYMHLEKKINESLKTKNTVAEVIDSIVEGVKQQQDPESPSSKSINKPKQSSVAKHEYPQYDVQQQPQIPVHLNEQDAYQLEGHKACISAVRWTPDGKYFASASRDSYCIVWDLEDKKSVALLPHDANNILCLDISRSGELIATGTDEGTVTIWTINGKKRNVFERVKCEGFLSVRFSPNGKYIASVSEESIHIWSLENGQLVQEIFAHDHRQILDISWRDNSIYTIACTHIVIYKVEFNVCIKVLKGHEKDTNCVIWDSTKRYLASCSDDLTVRVWKPFENDDCYVLQHRGPVYTITWIPGEKLILASGCLDGTCTIWNVEEKQKLKTIDHLKGGVYCLTCSPLGNYLVVTGKNPTAYIYRTSDFELLATYKCTTDNDDEHSILDASWSPKGGHLLLPSSSSRFGLLSTDRIPFCTE